ncbi:DM13 domain-containing protein [Yoonia sp.]|uniref:DM13 domain-containing protein n=1 Tax=Yoonia sp. TaxID=2212373 RepID=UPI0035C86BDD
MRGKIFAFILGGIIGLPAGAFLWYAFSPLLFDAVVSETLSEAQVIAQGQFRDADRAHSGSGTAQLVVLPDGRIEVQLTEFRVTNGPDLEVWLSSHPDPAESSDVLDNEYLSLGTLKGNVGDQSYPIPQGTALADFQSIVIWCEQFGVLFSPASFEAL